jgi:putative ABC transport system permease protein
MNTENHIWNLITKKLATEASGEELDELNDLLKQNPDFHRKVKVISEWWHDNHGQKTVTNDYLLFQIVLGRIVDNTTLC